MDQASVERLEFHLPGLLGLLGESLYSDPRVAYRELVQNAHDACMRCVLRGDADYAPRIEVAARADNGRTLVVISDNGLGLDADDIRQFLATIGRGQTGELRSMLEASGTSDHERLVGQFGVGLLSAFLVADRVEIRTRRSDRDRGYLWVSEGKQTYRLEPLEHAAIGTEVVLRIRADRSELGSIDVVRDAVSHFAGYLEIPIRVAGQLINEATLPWRSSAGRRRLDRDELAAMWCPFGEPLATIELVPIEADGKTIPLHGVLVIPEGSQLSLHELGHVGVLIRGMLITPDERELLPPWARFVTGIVDCAALEPTASREQVRRGPTCARVQAAIARQLLAGLARIRIEEPAVWSAILEGHSSMLKSWGARHPELFDAICDDVPFYTTRGEMTLPAYLEAIDERAIYYIDDDQQARSLAMLLESTSRPVVAARYAGDLAFLRAFAAARDVRLVRELEAEGQVVTEIAVPPPALARLAGSLVAPDLDVRVARFLPALLPAFVRVPSRVETQSKARRAIGERRVHAALGSLLGQYSRATPEQPKRTLFINADNPLIRHLADDDSIGGRAAAQLIVAIARLVSGETLAPNALMEAYSTAQTAIGALMNVDVRAPAANPIPADWATRRAGLSPKHSRKLATSFASFQALVRASDHEIVKLLELPITIAGAIRTLASEETP